MGEACFFPRKFSKFYYAVNGDVRNIFFILVGFRFNFLKKTRIRFGMSLVQYGSKNAVRFGYYSYLLAITAHVIVN